MHVKFDANVDAFRKSMKNAQKQIPRISTWALNDTAKDVRKHIVEKTYPESFDVKNKSFAKSTFRIEFAKANSPGEPSAAVFDKAEFEFLSRQVFGGVKKDDIRGWVHIPTNVIKKTGRGFIRKKDTPQQILKRKDAFRLRKNSGPIGIYSTVNKVTRAYYFLYDRVFVPKRFPFYKEAERVAVKHYPQHLSRIFNRKFGRSG